MNAIRAHRVKAGLTQAQLATKSGVAVLTISRLENSQNQPTARIIGLLARALEIEPWDLVREHGFARDFDTLVDSISDEDLIERIRGDLALRRVVAAFILGGKEH